MTILVINVLHYKTSQCHHFSSNFSCLCFHLCRGMRCPPPTNECPGSETKHSNGKVPVMLELWGL